MLSLWWFVDWLLLCRFMRHACMVVPYHCEPNEAIPNEDVVAAALC